VETVIFSVHALLNCWRIPNSPWYQVDVNENLAGVEMDNAAYYQSACRKLFELRMSLLPYLYSAFVEYHKTGLPPVRALCMDAPAEERLRAIDDQFMFGKDLLVCPLTLEDGTERKVYLPSGVWYNFFTGEKFEGGQEITVQADWDQIPVFAREGGIVPLAKPVQHVAADTVFELSIRTFGDAAGEFTLYEDDFTTCDYEKTGHRAIIIRRSAEGTITVDGLETSCKYRMAD